MVILVVTIDIATMAIIKYRCCIVAILVIIVIFILATMKLQTPRTCFSSRINKSDKLSCGAPASVRMQSNGPLILTVMQPS